MQLDPSKAGGRLRCRYAPVKLAPGNRVDLFVVLRGDEVGKVGGTVEVSFRFPVTVRGLVVAFSRVCVYVVVCSPNSWHRRMASS